MPPPGDQGGGPGFNPPGEAVAPPPDAGQTDANAETVQWRRLHRVTPLLNAWKAGAAIFLIALYNSQEYMADLRRAFPAIALLGMVVALLVVGFVIGLVIAMLAWRRTQYGVGEESVFLHKGILFRQQRHVRLDRVQAVEVTQPLMARIFGFASLKVESAGGAGSNLQLAYLTEPDAQNLRNELLARVAGIKYGTAASHPGAQPGPGVQPGAAGAQAAATPPAAIPEREIAVLPPGRLVGSLALSLSVVAIVLALLVFVVAAIATRTPGIIAGSFAPMLASAAYLWGRFAGEFSFRAAVSPDGIRLRHGLLETKARTVPPGRVQAVSISQPVLWRIKDWWRIQVNIAGYGPEETTGTVLYPVATREEVAFMLSLVLPDLGDERPLPVLHAGMDGFDGDEGYVTSPKRARWVDPLVRRRTAFRITDTAILMRTGRLWRRLQVVPHERAQSLGITQGPLERLMRLATFVVHSTPGPVVPQVPHLDLEVARELLRNQAVRAREARRSAKPQQWWTPAQPGPGQHPAASEPGVQEAGVHGPGVHEAGVHGPGRGNYGGVLPSRTPADSATAADPATAAGPAGAPPTEAGRAASPAHHDPPGPDPYSAQRERPDAGSGQERPG